MKTDSKKPKTSSKTDALANARKSNASKKEGGLFPTKGSETPADVAALDAEIDAAKAKFGTDAKPSKKAAAKAATEAPAAALEDDDEESAGDDGDDEEDDPPLAAGETPAEGAARQKRGGTRAALVKTLSRTEGRIRRFLDKVTPEAAAALTPTADAMTGAIAWLNDLSNPIVAKRGGGPGRRPSADIPVGASVKLTRKAADLYRADDPEMIDVTFIVKEKGSKLATLREPHTNKEYTRIPLAHLKGALHPKSTFAVNTKPGKASSFPGFRLPRTRKEI